MNIFKGINRKQKREFDKLDNDKKAELLHAAIIDKISGTMSTEIAKSMIAGMELEREQLYQKYVKNLDSYDGDKESWFDKVEEFLSYFRVEHIKYQQKQNKNIQNGEKNEV